MCIRDRFKSALDFDGPALINVRVRRGENCYPMVPPGKSNAQMVGYVNSESWILHKYTKLKKLTLLI